MSNSLAEDSSSGGNSPSNPSNQQEEQQPIIGSSCLATLAQTGMSWKQFDEKQCPLGQLPDPMLLTTGEMALVAATQIQSEWHQDEKDYEVKLQQMEEEKQQAIRSLNQKVTCTSQRINENLETILQKLFHVDADGEHQPSPLEVNPEVSELGSDAPSAQAIEDIHRKLRILEEKVTAMQGKNLANPSIKQEEQQPCDLFSFSTSDQTGLQSGASRCLSALPPSVMVELLKAGIEESRKDYEVRLQTVEAKNKLTIWRLKENVTRVFHEIKQRLEVVVQKLSLNDDGDSEWGWDAPVSQAIEDIHRYLSILDKKVTDH